MEFPVPLLLLLFAACHNAPGPAGPTDDADTADIVPPGDTPDGGDPTLCTTVCWSWGDPIPLPPPTAAPAPIAHSSCNELGVEPGDCPAPLTCGAPRTTAVSPGFSVTQPYCEGAEGAYELTVDLVPPVPIFGHAVELDFTLGDGEWPTGTPGTAGSLRLTHRTSGEIWRLPVPTTADGALHTALAAGDWDVTFERATLDTTTFPSILRAGVLTVAAAGSAEVPVNAASASVHVNLDNAEVPTVPASTTSITLTFTDPAQGSVSRTLFNGDALTAPIVLPYGTWQPRLAATSTDDASPFPAGEVVGPTVSIGPGDPPVAGFDLHTVTTTGTLTLNGNRLGETLTRVELRDAAGGGGNARVTDDGSTTAWSVRTWPGTYDLWVNTGVDPNLVRGKVLAATGVVGGTSRDLAVTSTLAAGTLTLNGAAPEDAEDGYESRTLIFVQADGSTTSLSVDTVGAARFYGQVWTGRSDLYLWTSGTTLPPAPTLVANRVQPSAGLRLDVTASPVDITLRVDDSPTLGDGNYRGLMTFTAIDAADDPLPGPLPSNPLWNGVVMIDVEGPAHVRTWLPTGRWRVAAATRGGSSLPTGTLILEDLNVAAATQRVYDRNTVRLGVTVTQNGNNLPEAPVRTTRGQVLIGDEAIYLPGVGAARVEAWLWSTDVDVSMACVASQSCGLEGTLPASVALWSGLAL